MPTFEIESGGKRYQVQAPSMDAALGVVMGQSQAPRVSPLTDVAMSGGSGLVQGVEGLAGLPGDVQTMAQSTGMWLGDKARTVMGKPALTDEQKAGLRGEKLPIPTTQDISGMVTKVTGFEPHQPQTVAGEYARTVGQFVPAAATFGGAGSILKYGIAPALASETAGQITKDTPAEPYARFGGALAGPLAYNAARRFVTPFPTTPDRVAAVDTLRQEGVTGLTAGQMTGNNKLRYMESELGGERAADMMAQQGDQFTSAVLRRAGINANRATPDVIDGAFAQTGAEFDRLAANNSLRLDTPAFRQLTDAMDTYESLVNPTLQAPIVRRVGDEIAGAVQAARQQGGTAILDGATYQSIRSLIGKQAQALRTSNPDAAQALREMQDALDGAMERSIRATNPNDLGAWQDVRNRYRNLLVIERAAGGAGEQAALGIISPAQLRAATQTVGGRRAYVRGQGDFADLARAGEATMRPMPNSGTASRTAARRIFEFGPMALGAGAGYAAGDLAGALAGTVAGAAIPSAIGRALLSQPGRAYLGNTILARPAPATVQELAAALINSSVPARALPQPGR